MAKHFDESKFISSIPKALAAYLSEMEEHPLGYDKLLSELHVENAKSA